MSAKKAMKRRGGFLRLLRNLFLLLLVLGAGAAYFVHADYQRFTGRELSLGDEELLLEVKRGDSFDDVLRRLRKAGVREGHDLQWKALAWQQGVMTRLQVGEYAIGHGLTPSRLLEKLERGEVIQHRFTIVEGWNFREVRLALAKETGLEQTLAGLPDAEVMKRIGAAGEHPEGRFLPETYNYTKGITDAEMLKRSYTAMQNALAAAWDKRAAELPLKTPYEALVLASIVEKETGAAVERPQIAGVFARRLKLGMKLQTDPTVIYGVGPDFNGNLTRKHLEDDTQYNTYVRFGLPPTPIAMPGRAALEAAVKPADGDTLYFVSRGDGTHEFTSNLADHNRAVARWQLRRR